MMSAAGALFVDDAAGRVDDVRVALVHHEEHVRVAGLIAAIGLDRVVEPEYRGCRTALHDASHRVEPVGERRERVRAADLGGRERVQAQPRTDDHTEGSFGADEALREIGPDRRPRRAAGRHEGAVGEHDVEAGDDVLDLAVSGRELACAAARDPSANRRKRHRLRPVPAGDAVVGAQLVLEHVAERPGLHVDEHRRVIDVDDSREAR